MIASYRNRRKSKGTIICVSNRDVTVKIENREVTYHGVYAEYRVGDLVELPLKSHSWSMVTRWSPFDEPSEYDIDD